MSALLPFDRISYEVEHPFFLAHIHQAYTGNEHITKNGQRVPPHEMEFAVKDAILNSNSVYKVEPVLMIYVKWDPKYKYVQSPIHDDQSTALRALYPFYFHVGDHYKSDDIEDLIREAKRYAETISDPADWKEGELKQN